MGLWAYVEFEAHHAGLGGLSGLGHLSGWVRADEPLPCAGHASRSIVAKAVLTWWTATAEADGSVGSVGMASGMSSAWASGEVGTPLVVSTCTCAALQCCTQR